MPNIVKYSGLKQLTLEEQTVLRKIIEEEYPRVQRLVKNITDVTVDVKTHDKGGKRKMYLIYLKAVAPRHVFTIRAKENEIQKSKQWDIAAAAHKAIDALEQEMKHKLKSSTESWRKTDIKRAIRKG